MMFDKVRNYDPGIPKGKFHLSTLRWGYLFINDFVFGLTKSKDQNGDQKRKMDHDTFIGRKFKKLNELNIRHVEKDNAAFNWTQPLLLPEIDNEDFDPELFKRWKNKINMPLVIKGFLKGAPILENSTIDSFIKNYGDQQVKCVKLGKSEDGRIGQNIETLTVSFKDYLTDEKYNQYYLNNFFGILGDEDFYSECKGDALDELQNQKNVLTQWFISRIHGSGSQLHCAGGDNMFLNIKGRKEWYFIDPSYSSVLRSALSKYGVYAVSELNEDLKGNFYDNLISEYPYMQKVPVYKYTLDEGDVLFNPPYWWHTVRNVSDFTVGCATRYLSNLSLKNSVVITISSLFDAVRHPRKSVIPQTISMVLKRNTRSRMIDSIFSKREE